MGKKLLKHMLVVGGVLIALGVIDWIIYLITGSPVLCIQSSGGECNIYIGLWFEVRKIYPLTKIGEPSMFCHVYFRPMFGVITFVVITAVSMIPFRLGDKKKS